MPSASKIDPATLKRELEEYGRKLRLMWHFRNDEQIFTADTFRPKSSFNPKNNGAIIDTYLSCLEERLLGIKILSNRNNSLTKDKGDAIYSIKDDSSIVVKITDRGSVFVLWDREDYLKET